MTHRVQNEYCEERGAVRGGIQKSRGSQLALQLQQFLEWCPRELDLYQLNELIELTKSLCNDVGAADDDRVGLEELLGQLVVRRNATCADLVQSINVLPSLN